MPGSLAFPFPPETIHRLDLLLKLCYFTGHILRLTANHMSTVNRKLLCDLYLTVAVFKVTNNWSLPKEYFLVTSYNVVITAISKSNKVNNRKGEQFIPEYCLPEQY